MKKIARITFLIMIMVNVHGSSVSDFSLPIYKSKEIFNLKQKLSKHSKVVINFWASWCTSCIEELPLLEKLKSEYQKDNVLFVAINAGESRKKIKRFLKKRGFSYLILEDKDRVISKKLGVTELPKTFVIEKNQNISFKGNRPPKSL